MFCNLMSIYRNPFKPDRHRTLYYLLAIIVPLATTMILGLNFNRDHHQKSCDADHARVVYLQVLLY
eukprot:426853-Amphidinium_carterae.1